MEEIVLRVEGAVVPVDRGLCGAVGGREHRDSAGRRGMHCEQCRYRLPCVRGTVLRLVDALPEPEVPAPRVVGVDEYATRKGRYYGTVLIDVETRRPVDLLPEREALSLAAWLADRPGVEVVCRDRAPFFAEGTTAGAPQAVQVADRWHLWHNLSEATERSVAQHRRCLRALVPTVPEPGPGPGPGPKAVLAADSSGSPWPRGQRFADRTRARHAAVHALLTAGHSRRSVQPQLGMTYRSQAVRQRGQWQNRPSVLDDYKPCLDDRWSEGCTNAWRLWEEIVPLGYKGSYQRVRAYLHDKRTSPQPVTARPLSPRTVAGWILCRPDTLTETEQLQLKAVRTHCSELEALTRHVRSFATMLAERQGERLPDWLDAVRQDDLPSLPTLAAGIDRDRDAVIAGLTLPWSSGVVEGHVKPDQDAQTPDVRPGRLPAAEEASPARRMGSGAVR
ncbi:ISL3 family transposase [Streptomyces sp. NPDC003456]|uniref:ISL3 family transposase n=1 Tax=Streptomyces sp. NPDC003456 TaxID=3364683 RepID=UPI0036C835FD